MPNDGIKAYAPTDMNQPTAKYTSALRIYPVEPLCAGCIQWTGHILLAGLIEQSWQKVRAY